MSVSEDACLLTKSLVKVKHQKKTSASPSEVYFAVLQQNDVPISIKAFLNPETDDEDIMASLGGLKYEIEVYKQIISKIIEEKYSPNFIGFVADGECDTDSDSFVEDAFNELNGTEDDTLVNLLMTQLAGGGKNPITTLGNIYPKLSSSEQLEVMFQIVYSLRVMNLMRLVHNDLHSGNILVEELPKPTTRFYRVPGKDGREKTFTIRTKYVPLIFDWDFGYAEQLGPNPKIDEDFCLDLNICNRFSEKSDLYTLLCTLDFPGPLGEQYERKVVKFKEREGKIPISEEAAEALKQNPQFLRGGKYFKMSVRKFNELSKGTLEEFSKAFGPDTSLLFTMDKRSGKHYIELQFGFKCRATSFSPDMPSPQELLDSKIFQGLETRRTRKQVPGKSGPLYTLPLEPDLGKILDVAFRSKPTKTQKSPVFRDPFRASSREKIKPVATKKKTREAIVTTEDSDTTDTMWEGLLKMISYQNPNFERLIEKQLQQYENNRRYLAYQIQELR